MAGPTPTPTLEYERERWRAGYCRVAGLDEAGRGALAGPVVAAAVIVPPDAQQLEIWKLVRDSKLLTAATRTHYAQAIQASALAWGVGSVDASVIDEIGIAAATRRSMELALKALTADPDFLLIDWMRLPHLQIDQQSLAKADQRIVSVAAASILAKTQRDAWLAELASHFPGYGFERHKGYGTPEHLQAIKQLGPCPQHRQTFAPIAHHANLFASEGQSACA